MFSSAVPVRTTCVDDGAPTKATVVPVAAAAALDGKNEHAFGTAAVAKVPDHEMVQVVVDADPIVILPDRLVLPVTTAPLVVVPQAPLAIVGVPEGTPVDWSGILNRFVVLLSHIRFADVVQY